MRISLDSKADALYIRLRKGKFSKNRRLDADTILDLDAQGRILGIEMLNASKRIPARELEGVEVQPPLKAKT